MAYLLPSAPGIRVYDYQRSQLIIKVLSEQDADVVARGIHQRCAEYGIDAKFFPMETAVYVACLNDSVRQDLEELQ